MLNDIVRDKSSDTASFGSQTKEKPINIDLYKLVVSLSS